MVSNDETINNTHLEIVLRNIYTVVTQSGAVNTYNQSGTTLHEATFSQLE